MPLPTFTCQNCESEFVAHEDSNAGHTRYCSPVCVTEGEAL